MTRLFERSPVLALLVAGYACAYPTLNHGPRIQSGLRFGFGLEWGPFQDDSTNRLTSVAGFGGYWAAGASPWGPDGAKFLLTAQGGLGGAGLDAYAQLPGSWAGRADVGVGGFFGSSSRTMRMLYAMYGRPVGRSSVYVAQGVAWMGVCAECRGGSQGSPPYVISATTLGIESTTGSPYPISRHLYLTVLLGRQQRTCYVIIFNTNCIHPLAILGYYFGLPVPFGPVPGRPDPFPRP